MLHKRIWNSDDLRFTNVRIIEIAGDTMSSNSLSTNSKVSYLPCFKAEMISTWYIFSFSLGYVGHST